MALSPQPNPLAIAVPSLQPYLAGENTIAVQRQCIFLAGLVPGGENRRLSCPPCCGSAPLQDDPEQCPAGCTSVRIKGYRAVLWARVRVSGLIWFCHKPARSHAVALI